jgi:hypothetical protein
MIPVFLWQRRDTMKQKLWHDMGAHLTMAGFFHHR